MSRITRKPASGTKRKPPAPRKSGSVKWRPKGSLELRQAAEQAMSRAEALQALFRPIQEAGQAELQRTASGRNLLEQVRTLTKGIDALSKRIASGKTSFAEGLRLTQERQIEFRNKYGERLVDAHARHAHLQPSVEAVAQTLRPEMASRTTWVSEASFLRAILLQPKRNFEDVGTVSQGLGDPPPPPVVRLCTTVPYDRKSARSDGTPLSGPSEGSIVQPGGQPEPAGVSVSQQTGRVTLFGYCFCTAFNPVGVRLASGFVGHDFPVPPGPTRYNLTVSYDWICSGFAMAIFGVAIISLNLAILIDKRDGTQETHAREVTLLTVPFAAGDGFSHSALDAKVTIPFTRDGSNGTVRVMVGADAHCTTVAVSAGGYFDVTALVREICITSVG